MTDAFEMRLRVRIARDSDLVHLMLDARRLSAQLGFEVSDQALIVTVISELGRNILKYAGQGVLTVQGRRRPRVALSVIAADRGPGIDDPDAALVEGFSTGGTLGLGLPAVRRMMDEFELDTTVGEGTRITTRKWL